jgi:molecular chaperone GrpE
MKEEKKQAEANGEENQIPEEEIIQEMDLDAAAESSADLIGADELSLEEQIEKMQSSLAEVTGKAEEYLDGWQRARAEFANYKKRVLKENTEIRQVARGEVIKLYLDILDDLRRALLEKPVDPEVEAWGDGIEIIYQKLLSRLEAEGVKPMNPLGEDFDPTIHEALMTEESEEFESGQIIEVMQEGYWLGEKVLRPALVRVAA